MSAASAWPTDDIEKTIEKYGDMLYRLCLVILKNESDAEDAVQETIIKLYQKAPLFKDGEHEKAWLIRVATNNCRDVLRRRLRNPQPYDDILANIPDNCSDSGVFEALASLPDKYRIVLTLYYVEEYSTEEIAKIISRTASAVKMRLQKGRKLLEETYRKEYM